MRIFIIFISFYTLVNGYKILIPLVHTCRSLSSYFHHMGTILAENGHQVTLITPYNNAKKHENLTLHLLDNKMLPYTDKNNFYYRKNDLLLLNDMLSELKITAEVFLQDKTVQDLWNKRNEFDVIIIDGYLQDAALIFLMDYNGKFVEVCTVGNEYWCIQDLGNRILHSVLPTDSRYSLRMNLYQRIVDVFKKLKTKYIITLLSNLIQSIVEKYHPDIGNIGRFYDRVDLMLLNSHHYLDTFIPLLPNQIEIGCLDCATIRTLPKDLEEYFEESGDAGIIYFSLGTVLRVQNFPPKILNTFLEAFARLPQKVIWKCDNNITNLPSNVITRTWVPQQAILSHPKTKVFISHCGIRSTQEAKYHGVPVLALPILVDQPIHAALLERRGEAIYLEWEDISTDLLEDSILKLIKDPSYKKRIALRSRLFQNERESSAERLLWWIDHIASNNDNVIFEFEGKNYGIIEYYMIDIFLLFFSIIIVFLVATFTCFKHFYKYVCHFDSKRLKVKKQ